MIGARMTYHDREADRRNFDLFDDPHERHADNLYDSEHVHSTGLHVTQIYVIWLILDWHKYYHNSFDELEIKKTGSNRTCKLFLVVFS